MTKRYTEKKHGMPFLPDAIFTFDDTAAVMLRTTCLNHEFVSAFNAAYRLRMSRVADIELEGGNYPCYSYYDELARLAYVVVARPAVMSGQDYYNGNDKLLLVRGRDAWDFQQQLYSDLSRSPQQEDRDEPPADEPLMRQHWELLKQLHESVFSLDTFSFGSRGISTSMYTGPAERMPRSTAVYLKRLQTFLATLFDTLQWHLCNEEEEL